MRHRPAIGGVYSLSYALRRIVRGSDRVLEAHRPQRRTAAQARVAFRSGREPGRRFVLHPASQSDRRRSMEALPRNRGEGRLRKTYRQVSSPSASKRRPQPRTRTSQHAVECCSAPTSIPTFTEVAGKDITAEAVTRKQAEGNILVPLPRRRGVRRCVCMSIRSGRPKAFMLVDVRQSGHGPRPLAVLMQLLRMRRHQSDRQHLFQVDRRGRKKPRWNRKPDRGGLRQRRRLKPLPKSGCSAAKRSPRGCRSARLRTRTRSAGHQKLHQRMKSNVLRNP